MRILLAGSEVHPFSKTGGLGDMLGAMARGLAKAGLEVHVVTPLYAGIDRQWPGIDSQGESLEVPLGWRRVRGRVRRLRWARGLTVHFVDRPEYYGRAHLYQEQGQGYSDNDERFIFLSKAVLEIARRLDPVPDVVHVHDWQVALVPLMLAEEKGGGYWPRAPRTCLTIHNLAYQGVFPGASFLLTNLPLHHFHPGGLEYHGLLNCLKAGILRADFITTVSPRYALEILTPAFGCGLDGVLQQRERDLCGILNGVDYSEWKTTGNPFLRHPYAIRNLEGKQAEKTELQRELGFSPDPDAPLFGNISRLVEQKGTDLLLAALEETRAERMQTVLLGRGAPELESACQAMARRYPNRIAVRLDFDQALSHRIEAACDFYLMPSRFEPCGLNQMYSLRYGTIPIVRATGGLDDSVVDPVEDLARATGIKFYTLNSAALAKAIRKALALYAEPELVARFRRNGMACDFSWDRTAAEYERLYRMLLEQA